MAPKTFYAPKAWKRPYTSIYNDNYRFGNSLYSGAVADIENRSKGYAPYFASPNPASIISDPGVRRAILEAELLTSSDILPTSVFESALHSSTANALHKSTMEQTTTTITSSGRRASDTFNSYSSAKELANIESGLEESRQRRRRAVANRPTTMYESYTSPLRDTHNYSSDPLEGHHRDWSLERWYAKAVRNAHRAAVFPIY